MKRRTFLKSSGLLAAGAISGIALPEASAAPKKRRDEEYSVIILGDTHFDTDPPTVYHEHYDEKDERLSRIQRGEFARNGSMWKERCPALLKRASQLADDKTRMVFQMGDIIQGDCGDPEVHKKMLGDAIDMLKAPFGGLPLVAVVGNHDIRGTGAHDAYHEYMPKRMAQELGVPVPGTTFSFNIGPDAYIFLDFNNPDDPALEAILEKTKGARHTFVVSHGPILPYNEPSPRWFFHGADNDKDNEARRHFRAKFAERNAIALCGHIHTTDLADWYGDGGRITQMTMNSVWKNEKTGIYEISHFGNAQYGSECTKDPGLIAEYKPGIKRYIHSIAAGSYKMTVGPERIFIDFYAGASEELSEGFILR